MNISKKVKVYHERMFPNTSSCYNITDPELIEIYNNFTIDEVVNCDDLDDRPRWMAILAALLGYQGGAEFKKLLPAALNFSVTAVEA